MLSFLMEHAHNGSPPLVLSIDTTQVTEHFLREVFVESRFDVKRFSPAQGADKHVFSIAYAEIAEGGWVSPRSIRVISKRTELVRTSSIRH